MTLIELTGIPGSGKSSLLPYIIKYYKNKGIKVYDKRSLILETQNVVVKKIYHIIARLIPFKIQDIFLSVLYKLSPHRQKAFTSFIVDNWAFYSSAMKFILDSDFSNNHKTVMSSWLVNLVSYYQLAKSILKKDEIFIFDEGFFHKVLNFFNHPGMEEIDYVKIKNYIDSVPEIKVLVYINLDTETCKARLVNRKLPGLIKDQSSQVIDRFLLKSNVIIDYSKEILKKRGVKCYEIDNSASPFDELVLYDQLNKLGL